MEVVFDRVNKSYGEVNAVTSFSLKIATGALHFLLGPSGCGKTTTLRMLAGLEQVTSGRILFDGKDITNLPAAQRGIGMVFQNYALWPHMTVLKNIEYGLKLKKLNSKTIKERLNDVLEMTQLVRFTDRYPGQLSGGQQQRVALARALAIRPGVLLLDEPLSNLDTKLRLEMRDNIARIHKTVGITTVYVTHDQKEALSLGTNITVMRAGKQIQTGTPKELYSNPKTSFLAGFIGETNLIPGEYERFHNKNHYIMTPLGAIMAQKAAGSFSAGDKVMLSVRPESVKIKLPDRVPEHANISYFDAKLEHLTYLGEYEQMILNTPSDIKVTSNIFNASDYNFSAGSALQCFINARDAVVLSPDSNMEIAT